MKKKKRFLIAPLLYPDGFKKLSKKLLREYEAKRKQMAKLVQDAQVVNFLCVGT